MDQNGAKRYSAALFEVAKNNDKVDEYRKQLKQLLLVFSENNDFLNMLNHPVIQLKDKQEMVQKAFKGNIDDEILALLCILIEHDKVKELYNVYRYFKDMVYDYKGIKIAYATTAVSMTVEESEELRDKLSAKYGCSIEIRNNTDPSILGGVYLKVGDEVIDGTVRGKLDKMKKELLKQSTR